jgi:hypothetical protein
MMNEIAFGSRRRMRASSREAFRTSASGMNPSLPSNGAASRNERRLASTRNRVRHGHT